jgi:hypothetical protein
MPLPKPDPGENESDFISRCMGDNTMITDFPDETQRAAVCYRQFEGEAIKSKLYKAWRGYQKRT